MTTIHRLIALSLGTALLAPLAALAGDGSDPFGFDQRVKPPASTLTRAEVQRQLAAHDPDAPGHDGWVMKGDTLSFVGLPGPGRSRAEVQRELAAYQRNAVSHDGFRMVGDSLQYVGLPDKATDPKFAGTDAMPSSTAR